MFYTAESIARVYFTNYPSYLYNIGNGVGNMGIAGIGLGLINAQRLFWIANVGIIIFLYNDHSLYIDVLLFSFCTYLYIVSFLKIIYLTRMLPIRH
jgi:hypothetical protein